MISFGLNKAHNWLTIFRPRINIYRLVVLAGQSVSTSKQQWFLFYSFFFVFSFTHILNITGSFTWNEEVFINGNKKSVLKAFLRVGSLLFICFHFLLATLNAGSHSSVIRDTRWDLTKRHLHTCAVINKTWKCWLSLSVNQTNTYHTHASVKMEV